jgi:hypothetical protein
MGFSITEELADLMKRTITDSYLYEETKMVLQSLDIPAQKLTELVMDGLQEEWYVFTYNQHLKNTKGQSHQFKRN